MNFSSSCYHVSTTQGEAAGTTTLSKSWYSAWLTRLNLELDESNFNGYRGDSKFNKFSEFANKVIQSFQQVGPYESVVLSPELFEAGNFIGISVDWLNKFLPELSRLRIYLSLDINSDRIFEYELGDIRGLALTIVFNWRLLRAPRGPQRRQFKRQAPSGSSSSVNNRASVNDASSEVSNHLEDSGTQNVIDEFFQPVKPTLIQLVRQILCEGRKVTCRLLGVILDESSSEELQKQATVRSLVPEVHLEITKFIDLYLMEKVLDDESEINLQVLFCSTEIGRASFVKQLEPD
ncbi:peroxisome biogenesis protein 22 [Phtheirospermum japonicum]|uniref:Peroxisome biogenesis protein 22 n=1 Tax=Phtheirospermum japonicum TaxID=374723 RepID=A0A830BFV7_9LAMI|nr:peroxisome biogenesis protein 22 [Phtheirospermum japonicum]